MAILSLNKKEIKKIVGNVSDEKLEETLSMFGTAVENITENEIELEIAPNRPDMLSQQGIERALKSYFGKKSKQYKVNKPEKDYNVKIEASVKEVRPFTACAIVKNLKFDDEKIKEIIDIQEKLHSTFGRNRKKIAIGIYPLEKIKLPITFKAEAPDKIKFIPLEASEEMTGMQILSRHPAGREYAHLLSNEKKFPVFIDAANNILSMPPIINSQLTGKIDIKTKDVFIECSGHDFNVLQKTLNMLVCLLSDMKGEIYAVQLNYPDKKIITPDLTPEKLKLEIKNVNKLLGLNLKEQEIKKLLEKMGYLYNKGTVEVPAYRIDILHEVDLIEDIAIAYGYDNFEAEIPQISTIGKESAIEIKKRKIAEILAGLSLLEISTYHLTTKNDMKKTGIKTKGIEVESSKTDFSVLRPCLLINSLKVLSENVDAKYPQKIFELGKIFKENLDEEEKLCITISGETDFTEISQVLDYLMRMLSLNYKIEETSNSLFIEGRTGKIILKNNGKEKEIGILGEISPNIIKNWHLKMPVVALEIEIEEL